MKHVNILVKQTDVVIITYDAPHRKTFDLINELHNRKYQNITVLALPFVKRENPFTPIYAHRPPIENEIMPEDLCRGFRYRFRKVNIEEIGSYLTKNKPDYTLIAGAGLLPDTLVNNHKLINSHPGLLPHVRGLDSLKWAIHEKKPLGVTSHFVNSEADAGFLIEQRPVPVYKNDSFEDVAFRQYQLEIDMLADSMDIIPNRIQFPELSTKLSKSTRRMPKNIENNLMADFDLYKKKFAVKS